MSGDHRSAIEGWRARKLQLQKQQSSAFNLMEQGENLNLLLSLGRRKVD